MDGLSIAGLRVLLHIGVDEFSFKKEETEELPIENTTTAKPCEPVETVEERVLWHAQYYTLGVWQQAQILYTYPELHSVHYYNSIKDLNSKYDKMLLINID